MAAVIGGLSLLQLAELIAALNGGALSLLKIHDELVKSGAKPSDLLPAEHQATVNAYVDAVVGAASPLSPAQSFIQNTLGR